MSLRTPKPIGRGKTAAPAPAPAPSEPPPAPAPAPLVHQAPAAIREALQREPGWTLGGAWEYELLSGSHEWGGVWRVRHGARVADVTVERIVTDESLPLRVGPITCYQWQAGPLDHRSAGAIFVDLAPAMEAAIADSHAMPIGIWYINARLPELRGMVHAGRVFWQRETRPC